MKPSDERPEIALPRDPLPGGSTGPSCTDSGWLVTFTGPTPEQEPSVGGIRPAADALLVDPHIPEAWGEVRIPVSFRGRRVVVQVQGDLLQVRARPEAPVCVGGGMPVESGPRGRRFRRSSDEWLSA